MATKLELSHEEEALILELRKEKEDRNWSPPRITRFSDQTKLNVFDIVYEMVERSIKEAKQNKCTLRDMDFQHFLYETVMTQLFGEDIFRKLIAQNLT